MAGLTDLIFQVTRSSIGNPIPVLGVIEFDCTLSEVHTGEAEVTDHPVEAIEGGGAIVSDHIRVLPESVELNGVVTKTPLVFLASLAATSPVFPFTPNPGQDRPDTAYWTLRKLKNDGLLLDVVTSLRSYKNMAITSLVISRDDVTGNVIDCTVSLREVPIATSLAIEQPIPEDVANNPAAEQAKKAKDAASSKQGEAAQSALAAMIGV